MFIDAKNTIDAVMDVAIKRCKIGEGDEHNVNTAIRMTDARGYM